MKIKQGEQANWDKCVEVNSKDPYSARCVSYAKDWAELMEAEIAKGKTVAEVAAATSRVADTDGITGFMYGAAASTLSHVWEHGEELRRWHNKDVAGEEQGEKANATPGAVVNPAVLVIG